LETIKSLSIDIAVELGATNMPVHQLLRLGRGAVIELETREHDDLTLLANNTPIASGQVMLNEEKIMVSVTKLLPRAVEKRDCGGLRSFGGELPAEDQKAIESGEDEAAPAEGEAVAMDTGAVSQAKPVAE
jgi:flagellar motor switch protein FliN/FliY